MKYILHSGTVLWLTGLSGSGKTSIALNLQKELEKKNLPVEVLDGDVVRSFFENDLGYSEKDRILNIKRIAFAAKLLADRGVFVIVSNITPYMEVRDFVRSKIKSYIQVYLKASLEDVKRRDVKGLYKKFQEKKQCNLIGVDDRYDVPRNPHIVVDTVKETLRESTAKILDYLIQEKVISNV